MQYGYQWKKKDEHFFLATWFWILYILTAFYFTINVSYPWTNLPLEVIYPKLLLSSSPSEYCYHILGHHRFEPLFFSKIMPNFWWTVIHRRNFLMKFPLSMLILGQTSCFLGSTIFEILQPIWCYCTSTAPLTRAKKWKYIYK